MTKEEKKAIVLEVSKKLNISVISASKLMQENKWKIEKVLPEEKKKPAKSKMTKKRKLKNKDTQVSMDSLLPEESPVYPINKKNVEEDPHWDFNLYLENCDKYRKHPELIPEVTQIGDGFWTMAEIVKYVKYLKTKNK